MPRFNDTLYLAMAKYVSESSPDPSTKVGAVLVRNKQLISYGCNAFPEKCTQSDSIYHDRDRKLNRVIHAEVRAILKAGHEALGSTLYVWPPSIAPSCSCCAAIAIEAGIVRCVYSHEENQFSERWEASLKEGLKMLREAKIPVYSLPVTDKFHAVLQAIRKGDTELRIKKNARINTPSETN